MRAHKVTEVYPEDGPRNPIERLKEARDSRTWTPDDHIIEAYKRNGGHIVRTAEELGMKAGSLYTRFYRNPELKQLCEDTLKDMIATAEGGLFNAVDAEEPWAIQFLLKHKGGYNNNSVNVQLPASGRVAFVWEGGEDAVNHSDDREGGQIEDGSGGDGVSLSESEVDG